MHALTVAVPPRTATTRGPTRTATARGPSRAVLLVLAPLAVALVAVALLAAAAQVQRTDLTVPTVGDAASAVWAAHLRAWAPCGPLPPQLPPVDALVVRLDCHGSVLAARARALELDPVR